jgi:hypothetical protein
LLPIDNLPSVPEIARYFICRNGSTELEQMEIAGN